MSDPDAEKSGEVLPDGNSGGSAASPWTPLQYRLRHMLLVATVVSAGLGVIKLWGVDWFSGTLVLAVLGLLVWVLVGCRDLVGLGTPGAMRTSLEEEVAVEEVEEPQRGVPAESCPDEDSEAVLLRGILTDDDIQLAVTVHRAAARKWLVIAMFVAFVVMVEAAIASSRALPSDQMAIAMRSIIVAGAALLTAFFVPRIWRPLELPGWPIARTITEDWMLVRDGGEQIDYPWEKIARARMSDGVVILYASDPPGAYIFPRRLFADQAEWQRFCNLVRSNTL